LLGGRVTPLFGRKEKTAEAQNILSKSLSSCPICGSKEGYRVEGFSLNFFTCLKCQSKFHSMELPSKPLKTIELLELGTNLEKIGENYRGIEILGVEMPLQFWQNFQTNYPSFLDSILSSFFKTVSKAVTIFEDDEKPVKYFTGQRYPLVTSISGDGDVSYKFEPCNGEMLVTTHRLVWFERGILKFDIPLQHVDSIAEVEASSPGYGFGGMDKARVSGINVKSKQCGVDEVFEFTLPPASKVKVNGEDFLRVVKEKAFERKGELKAQKKKERIHLVLDFSSLKEEMKKGGLVMSTFKCPNCGASLPLPKSGKVLVCKHCNAPIKPIDIFEKIKSLIE